MASSATTSDTSSSPPPPASETANAEKSNEKEQEEEDNRSFECNICLDVARNAVISLCGHLFCWPCLHQWLEIKSLLLY